MKNSNKKKNNKNFLVLKKKNFFQNFEERGGHNKGMFFETHNSVATSGES